MNLAFYLLFVMPVHHAIIGYLIEDRGGAPRGTSFIPTLVIAFAVIATATGSW